MKICFNQGVKCDSRCRCKDCENQPDSDKAEEEAVTGEMEFAPRAELMDVKLELEPESVQSTDAPCMFAADTVASYQDPPMLLVSYEINVAREMKQERKPVWEI